MFEERFTHAFSQLHLSVHDISVSALAAAVIMLGVVLLMELRCVLRMRQVVDNQLGRVFEQLDLLRFETQQLLEGQHCIDSRDSTAVARIREAALAPVLKPVAPTVPVAALSVASAPGAQGTASQQAAPAPATVTPAAALRPAAHGVTSGEARLLASLAQARSRRAQGVSA
ncbi:MAG TPA: hypothetical protein VN660_02815 [Steroidobacteraceae bacterium]|nr:hypothetical protein [Steroidobacteraceae bacterium]